MGSNISVSTSTTVPISSGVPLHGVRLKYVNDFITSCGGVDALKGLTTDDVCKQFVKPHTAQWKCSYCELLAAANHPALALDGAIFISHAWKYEFLAVVEALEYTFRDKPDVVVWFDIFTINQHSTVIRDFDWWCTTFKSAIAHFDHTVMVLAPWMDPIPLTRAWCLFELWATVHGKCRFEVAMSASEITAFLSAMVKNSQLQMNKMLSTIDVGNSTAYLKADETQIKEAVNKTVGFVALNKVVFDQLRFWMADTMSSSLDADPDNLDLMYALGRLYREQGRLADAEPLFVNVLHRRQQTLGEYHTTTLSTVGLLAELYKTKGVLQYALAGYRQVLGETHPYTLNSMNHLAVIYRTLGDYAAAEPLLQSTLCGRQQELGDNHEDTLASMNNLASLFRAKGDYAAAEPLYQSAVDGSRQLLGDTDFQTQEFMNNLAGLYEEKGDYVAAEPLYQSVLAGRQQELGNSHPYTLTSINNLADLCKAKGDYAAAEPLYQSVLTGFQQVLGGTHPSTLQSIRNLVGLYKDKGDYAAADSLWYHSALNHYRQMMVEDNRPSTFCVEHSSWLYKIGSFFPSEMHRWFVMEADLISYYTNETKVVMKEQFEVEEVIAVTQLVCPAMSFSIITSGVHGGIFKCRCSSQEDYDGWVAAFRRCGLSV